ncbi:TcaA NTF2-like domain-containing protein [Virgibacillus sediminis]|uniref:Zinc ribbon domain-containing protein n=1 Tax=Virgibacillus sediminis TaxID=202260 RepID=A0ABV7A921_9BACI
MSYCTECGSALSPELGYCTECGAKRGAAEPADRKQAGSREQRPRPVHRQPPRRPMAKRQKILLAAVAGLVLLLFGTHQFLSYYFDPVRDLKAMDRAVSAGNVEEFLSFIEFDEGALLDEESYFSYIKGQEWDQVREQYLALLEEQEEAASPFDETLPSSMGEQLFVVQKKPVVFGLYTSYSLKAVPGWVTVQASMDDTEVHVGEHTQTLQKDGEEEITVYPGKYPVSGRAENEFGVFTYEDTVEVAAGSVVTLPISFDSVTYSLETNKPEATLFIDGEDTGKSLEAVGEIGPVPEDQELELHAEWTDPEGETLQVKAESGWENSYSFHFEEADTAEDQTAFLDVDVSELEGEAQSPEEEPEPAEDDTPADLETEEEEEGETAQMELQSVDAGDIVLVFRDSYENALNQKSFGFIEPYIQSGSQAHSDLQTYIADLADTDYHYEFTSNDILGVEEVDGETVEVTTSERFTFTNDEQEVVDYDRQKVYTLSREDGTYRISDIEYLETNRDRQ